MRKTSKYKRKRDMAAKNGFSPIFRLPKTIRFGAQEDRLLKLLPHDELENFRLGLATDPSWHTITARINMGYVLAGEHFPDERVRMEACLAHLRAVHERHQKTGTWGMTGEEFHTIGDGLNYCDEMQNQCTRRELDDALSAVYAVSELKQKGIQP